jgi:hypothetical protein
MSDPSAAMLRALGSGIVPAGAERPAPALRERAHFGELLAKAQSGELSSGAPVRVMSGAGVKLTGSQLSRLSAAADQAEAAGAARALVLIDGMVLTMDVGVRTITGVADLSRTQVAGDVDAVITVAPEDGAVAAAMPPSSSLLKMLSRFGKAA